MHWSRKRTKEFELNNLEIIKLNTGNEKTFWFNLILLLMKINKIFIFSLKELMINIIDYNYAKKINLANKFLKFSILLLFSFNTLIHSFLTTF